MVDIYFVRHGQPEWSTDGLSNEDPALTELGCRHAARAGEEFKNIHFDYFFVSPLRRARQTAGFIAEACGKHPVVLEWLREYQAKYMDKRPVQEVADYFRAWMEMPLRLRWDGPPQGESFTGLRSRIGQGMDGLLSSLGMTWEADGDWRKYHAPENDLTVLIVGHTYACATAAGHLLGGPHTAWEGEQLRMGWGAYNRLSLFPLGGGFIWRLRSVDERRHLQGLPNDV